MRWSPPSSPSPVATRKSSPARSSSRRGGTWRWLFGMTALDGARARRRGGGGGGVLDAVARRGRADGRRLAECPRAHPQMATSSSATTRRSAVPRLTVCRRRPPRATRSRRSATSGASSGGAGRHVAPARPRASPAATRPRRGLRAGEEAEEPGGDLPARRPLLPRHLRGAARRGARAGAVAPRQHPVAHRVRLAAAQRRHVDRRRLRADFDSFRARIHARTIHAARLRSTPSRPLRSYLFWQRYHDSAEGEVLHLLPHQCLAAHRDHRPAPPARPSSSGRASRTPSG